MIGNIHFFTTFREKPNECIKSCLSAMKNIHPSSRGKLIPKFLVQFSENSYRFFENPYEIPGNCFVLGKTLVRFERG